MATHRAEDDGSGNCLHCGKPTRVYDGVLRHKMGRITGVSPWRLSDLRPPAPIVDPSFPRNGHPEPESVQVDETAPLPAEPLRYAHWTYDLSFLRESPEDSRPLGTPAGTRVA